MNSEVLNGIMAKRLFPKHTISQELQDLTDDRWAFIIMLVYNDVMDNDFHFSLLNIQKWKPSNENNIKMSSEIIIFLENT